MVTGGMYPMEMQHGKPLSPRSLRLQSRAIVTRVPGPRVRSVLRSHRAETRGAILRNTIQNPQIANVVASSRPVTGR